MRGQQFYKNLTSRVFYLPTSYLGQEVNYRSLLTGDFPGKLAAPTPKPHRSRGMQPGGHRPSAQTQHPNLRSIWALKSREKIPCIRASPSHKMNGVGASTTGWASPAHRDAVNGPQHHTSHMVPTSSCGTTLQRCQPPPMQPPFPGAQIEPVNPCTSYREVTNGSGAETCRGAGRSPKDG